MKCQQKSGVFLNLECQNAIDHKCFNCDKEVCDTHSHNLGNLLYCEDCYWERFLFTQQQDNTHYNDSDTDTTVIYSSNSSSSSPVSSNNEPTGFKDGFGGGEFGGGGAAGAWTEGDIQSLSDTNNTNNLMSDSDDSFFYS